MRFLMSFAPLLVAPSVFAADVVYVSIAGEKRIEVYQIKSNGGELRRIWDIFTTGEPGALTTDPKRRLLFAALRSTGELASFRIEPATGKLTHINTVEGGADPAHISVDKTGKYLLNAYYVAGQVTVHEIAADGSLGKKARQTYKTKEKAHAAVFDPDEMAVLVPHTGPNVIYALAWLERNGELTDLGRTAGIEIEVPKNTGPRHLVFHPTLRIHGGLDIDARVGYVANEQGNSVTMHHAVLNPINWGVTPKQSLSTLPEGFTGTNACAEIRLHPSNQFLYVSNRGHDSIAAFRVDRKTGKLTGLGQTPTQKTPRSFDIDPSGKYLFAAGESSGRLAAYGINEDTGVLKELTSYEVGKKLWWVMAVRLPEK